MEYTPDMQISRIYRYISFPRYSLQFVQNRYGLSCV